MKLQYNTMVIKRTKTLIMQHSSRTGEEKQAGKKWTSNKQRKSGQASTVRVDRQARHEMANKKRESGWQTERRADNQTRRQTKIRTSKHMQ